ncbi:hypothetical protein [Emticicia sp.]|uniref:hypothetical protein n=1 Tax=Emticicia sp. TaxID=1930953 RepID=UPI00374FE791
MMTERKPSSQHWVCVYAGGDVVTMGCISISGFVSALIKHELIGEFDLLINPVVYLINIVRAKSIMHNPSKHKAANR